MILSVVAIVTVLLLIQTVSVVEAHHKKKDSGETRKAAEIKSEKYDNGGNLKTTIEEKREAFLAYKIAFDAWKSAKELWKTAKSSGTTSDISGNQTLVDATKVTKDEAWETYQDAKKKKAR